MALRETSIGRRGPSGANLRPSRDPIPVSNQRISHAALRSLIEAAFLRASRFAQSRPEHAR